MVLLGLDTATSAVTVALLSDAGEVLAASSVLDARGHGERLAPGIARVLSDAGATPAQVTAIAVGVGPGPFTSLRVGLVTARVLAATLDIPVHGVCTLDAMALASGIAEDFHVITDARRKEVYWAAYSGTSRTAGPHVDRPTALPDMGTVVGSGAALYPNTFQTPREPLHADAVWLCRWVQHGLATFAPEPLYLRRPDATEPVRPVRP